MSTKCAYKSWHYFTSCCSFSFVTFKAAVSYLQTVDITQILPKTSIGLPKQVIECSICVDELDTNKRGLVLFWPGGYPCPFQAGISLSGTGVPPPRTGVGLGYPAWEWGTPTLGLVYLLPGTVVPPLGTWVPPHLGLWYPPLGTWVPSYPHLGLGTLTVRDWSTPYLGMGYPPGMDLGPVTWGYLP